MKEGFSMSKFSWIPWFEEKDDYNYLPHEEFQVSRVGINENTGKEEVLHYSLSNHESDVGNYLDSINFYSYNIYDRFF